MAQILKVSSLGTDHSSARPHGLDVCTGLPQKTLDMLLLSRTHNLPQTAILFSQLANITSMTNKPSTNNTENTFLEILLAPIIVHSKGNEIA